MFFVFWIFVFFKGFPRNVLSIYLTVLFSNIFVSPSESCDSDIRFHRPGPNFLVERRSFVLFARFRCFSAFLNVKFQKVFYVFLKVNFTSNPGALGLDSKTEVYTTFVYFALPAIIAEPHNYRNRITCMHINRDPLNSFLLVSMASSMDRGHVPPTTRSRNMAALFGLIPSLAVLVYSVGHPYWHLSKQGIRWLATRDHLTGSGLELIVFFKVDRWPLTGFRLDCRLMSG